MISLDRSAPLLCLDIFKVDKSPSNTVLTRRSVSPPVVLPSAPPKPTSEGSGLEVPQVPTIVKLRGDDDHTPPKYFFTHVSLLLLRH
jgi:hypothetical protein